MGLGVFALLAAIAAAGWLLYRSTRSGASEQSNIDWLKGVVFLALSAALFAAKLWPLAFMTLVAAGGVTAIEIWRKRAVVLEEEMDARAAHTRTRMDAKEAASILGIAADASAEDIKAAHRKLIGQLHPDRGGSDYLAAKINEARDHLLSARDAPPTKLPD